MPTAARAASPGRACSLDGRDRAGTSISAASVMVGDRWRDIEAGRRPARARSSSTTVTPTDHVSSRPCRRQPDGCGRTDPRARRRCHRMTQAAKGSAANGPATDDWEAHWSEYADAASRQPRAGVPAAAHPRRSSDRAGEPHRVARHRKRPGRPARRDAPRTGRTPSWSASS